MGWRDEVFDTGFHWECFEASREVELVYLYYAGDREAKGGFSIHNGVSIESEGEKELERGDCKIVLAKTSYEQIYTLTACGHDWLSLGLIFNIE